MAFRWHTAPYCVHHIIGTTLIITADISIEHFKVTASRSGIQSDSTEQKTIHHRTIVLGAMRFVAEVK